jgi:ABC-type dipeptide/oligopeptide/nickel transport system permease subunit
MTINRDSEQYDIQTDDVSGGVYDDQTQTQTQTQAMLDAQVMMEEVEGRPMSPFWAATRRLMRDRRAMISLGIIVFIVGISFIGPLVYQHIGPTIIGGPTLQDHIGPQIYHDYTHQELTRLNQPPSAAYPLGTDQLGRDILARLMAGVQVSILVTIVVVTFDVILGLIVGTLAGFYGGWMDTFLARFTDLMFAFPILLFAILAAATLGQAFIDRFGPSGRLLLVSLALGFTIWPQMARYVRGQTLQLKGQQFIEASRSIGATNRTLILGHIVPNLFNIVLTAATLDVVGIITAEATLSLLGLGVQAPGSSLGLMISDSAGQIYIQWTEVLWPTLVLAVLVLSFSFVGDGVGDAFNPRTKD